jgi:hypothetical protein
VNGEGVEQDDANEDEGNQGERLQDEMQNDAMLQQQLSVPLPVDGAELLVALDAVVVDGQKLASRATVLEVGKDGGSIGGGCLRAGGRGDVALTLGCLVLDGERGGIRVGLLDGLLD